jgi:F0F1-type ATP synthase membrane subunit b/b'
VLAAASLVSIGCSDDPAAPDSDNNGNNAPVRFTEADLRAEGDVVATDDGYTVKGALHVDTEEGTRSFMNADLNVEFDEDGYLKNVSGKAEIPPPSDNIEFEDPIQADVGFFSGKFLNENRDFNILLKEDTEYFVFFFKLELKMNIGTDDPDATKPLSIKAPVGGEALFITDFRDPMYYTYGAQDLLGAAGIGRSLKGRIPFVPIRPIEDIGTFDGTNIRTGTFPIFKIIDVEGVLVDNEYTEVHLAEEDPLASDLRKGYQGGVNGSFDVSLVAKDILEFSIPLGEASAGIHIEAGVQGGLYGQAYINGIVDPDLSWWPKLLPFKPDPGLEATGLIESTGRFDLGLHGEFGLETPGVTRKVEGDFIVKDTELTLKGAVSENDVTLAIVARISEPKTEVAIAPPPQLITMIDNRVGSEVDDRIAEAEQAYQDLQDATADYEFELSLRGLRSTLPGAVDAAKKAVSDGIANELKKHEGEVYYNSLKSHLYSADNSVHSALNNLKTQAQSTTDSDAWRKAMESALRTAAGYKYFETTYKYKVAGVTIKTVHIKKRVLSDSQVNKLNTAANNVKYIKETSNIKIQAQQIYDAIPAKEIFERVKDDIENGTALIPDFEEFGYVRHHHGDKSYDVYAVIGGERREMGQFDTFDLTAAAEALAAEMVNILIAE